MPFRWFLEPWNAIYTIPLAVVLIFVLVTAVVSLIGGAIGNLGEGVADREHEFAGADVSADHHEVAHDVETGDIHSDAVQHHGDLGSHGDRDHHHSGEHHPDVSPILGVLMFLGVGKAPLLLVLQIWLLLWGLTGTLMNMAAEWAGPLALAWTVPVAGMVSSFGTRFISRLFGRYYRPHETMAVHQAELVGRSGRVVYDVTEDTGTISVRDHHGTLHRVRARTAYGPIETGRDIVILGYDPQLRLYQVDDASRFVER